MNNKEILQEQHGNAAIEPSTSVQLHHPIALRNVAALDQHRVSLRLPKRVAYERYRHVSPNASVPAPHTMSADTTCLGISEDDANRHSNHAHAIYHSLPVTLQKRVTSLAQWPEGIKRQAQSHIVS